MATKPPARPRAQRPNRPQEMQQRKGQPGQARESIQQHKFGLELPVQQPRERRGRGVEDGRPQGRAPAALAGREGGDGAVLQRRRV